MYNTNQDLLDAFRATPETLAGLLRHCTQEQAEQARGGDENWSVAEVVCHLRDAEERALERMRAMRDQDRPFLPAYDQDAWAQERNYAATQLGDALAAFQHLRATYIADLIALPSEAWLRSGIHAEAGEITIQSHVLHLVSHDMVHMAQIARQLQVV